MSPPHRGNKRSPGYPGRSSCLRCLPGFLCVLGFWCFQCFFHILLTTADIANAVVVDLHGPGSVFRPLYLFLVDHDPLNERPQQLWRQLRDIRVPLCFIKEAVRSVPGFPQALDLSLSVEYRRRFPPHTGVLPLRRARDASRCERRLHGARLCQKVISGSVNAPNPMFYALHGKKYFRMRGIVF